MISNYILNQKLCMDPRTPLKVFICEHLEKIKNQECEAARLRRRNLEDKKIGASWNYSGRLDQIAEAKAQEDRLCEEACECIDRSMAADNEYSAEYTRINIARSQGRWLLRALEKRQKEKS